MTVFLPSGFAARKPLKSQLLVVIAIMDDEEDAGDLPGDDCHDEEEDAGDLEEVRQAKAGPVGQNTHILYRRNCKL